MRRLRGLVAVATLLFLVSACKGPTFSSLPLPGDGVSGDTIMLRADFGEALNLSPGAIVKVNGVDSGRVRRVRVHDFRARVSMEVKKSARLHRGATARLRYTTPLGELFVDVSNPPSGALLRSGSTLPRHSTSTAPTVEDSLSEASLLINGGGLSQLETITTELNKALGGRTGTVRDLMERANRSLARLNASSADVDRAVRALAGVSKVLDRRRHTLHAALHRVRPAAAVLRADLGHITRLLRRLDHFARTADGTVVATRAHILDLVRKAGPILEELAGQRKVLPSTLHALVRLAHDLNTVMPNDYLNLGVHLDLSRFTLGSQGRSLGLSSLDQQLARLGSGPGRAGAGKGAGKGAGAQSGPGALGRLLGSLWGGPS